MTERLDSTASELELARAAFSAAATGATPSRRSSASATSQPGLYFVGLHFPFAMSSTMIHGVGRDAARIVAALAARRALV